MIITWLIYILRNNISKSLSSIISNLGANFEETEKFRKNIWKTLRYELSTAQHLLCHDDAIAFIEQKNVQEIFID